MSNKLPLDPDARRQVLLTRIAFERNGLRRDVDRLRQATTMPHLVRSVLGLAPGSSWFGGTRGADAPGADNWIGTGLAWLRRYRLAASVLGTLFGGAAPLLRRRGRWGRLLLFAAAGGAAYWLWSNVLSNTRRGDGSGG